MYPPEMGLKHLKQVKLLSLTSSGLAAQAPASRISACATASSGSACAPANAPFG